MEVNNPAEREHSGKGDRSVEFPNPDSAESLTAAELLGMGVEKISEHLRREIVQAYRDFMHRLPNDPAKSFNHT